MNWKGNIRSVERALHHQQSTVMIGNGFGNVSGFHRMNELKKTATLWRLVKRGIRKQCPHCGQGPLFRKWFQLHPSCMVCGYRFERSAGDTWGFWVVGDRILIAAVIVLLYFGFTPETRWGRAVFLAAVVIPLVWTMPHRKGVGVALDYLSRIHLDSLDEEFPPVPEEVAHIGMGNDTLGFHEDP